MNKNILIIKVAFTLSVIMATIAILFKLYGN